MNENKLVPEELAENGETIEVPQIQAIAETIARLHSMKEVPFNLVAGMIADSENADR